ncbi:MAG: SDR family NAD(P)-dependent oxidoreductase, partial [Rubrivivax sp.]
MSSKLSPQSLFGLQDRIAFVPGGYGGIGSAIARGLALSGAKVAVAGRDADKADAFAATLRSEGHAAIGLEMDAHR